MTERLLEPARNACYNGLTKSVMRPPGIKPGSLCVGAKCVHHSATHAAISPEDGSVDDVDAVYMITRAIAMPGRSAAGSCASSLGGLV